MPPLDARARERQRESASAITARPTDRCGVESCGRLFVAGACMAHPPGWDEVAAVKALYRQALAAHGAMVDADRRAQVRAWLDGIDAVF